MKNQDKEEVFYCPECDTPMEICFCKYEFEDGARFIASCNLCEREIENPYKSTKGKAMKALKEEYEYYKESRTL